MDGSQVLEFSLAVDVGFGDKERATIWPKCSMFGGTWRETRAVFDQGTQVAVSGRVNLRWQDRDGGKRSTLEVRVDKVEMIGSKRDDAGRDRSRRNGSRQPASPRGLAMMTSLSEEK